MLGSQNDVPRVLGKGTVFRIINDHGIAGHGQGGNLAERIYCSGIGIRNEDHIALFYNGISIVGGIKADTGLHGVLRKILSGDRNVAVLPVNIHHFEIDHFDAVFPDHGKNILNSFCHKSTPSI